MAEQLTSALIAASQANKEAEAFIEGLKNQNYGELMKLLALEVADPNKDIQARQAACLYIKNTLAGQSSVVQKEKHDRWKQLNPEIRTQCKECLIQGIRSSPDLAHFVSLAAAEIAVVELPFNEWPTLVSSLMENVTQGEIDEKIKIASLECLGYVCDRIAFVEEMVGNMPELDSTIVDSMLTTIVDAVQPGRPDKMRFAALQALKNSLLFVRKNMETKQERDFIMNAIGEACTSQHAGMRALAFSCFDTVAECYYEMLQDYMTNIFQYTTNAISNDAEEDVKGAAIEFWNTLAETETIYLEEEDDATASGIPANRPPCPRYVFAVLEHLVPLLLNLLTMQNEDDDDDTNNMQDKAATCLELMCLTVRGAIVRHVVPYVTQNIQSQDWRLRDAAIVAFMSILDGPSVEEIGQYVGQSIQIMLTSFNDGHAVVRGSAVHCVRKICAHQAACLSNESVTAILSAMDAKLKDRPSIAAAACSTIYEIAQSLKQVPPPPTNILSPGLVQIMKALLEVTDRPDSSENNLRVVAMAAASATVHASAADVQEVFKDLLPVIAGRLGTMIQLVPVSNDDKEIRAQMIGQLAALIQTLYQRMSKETVLAHTDGIMTLLLQAVSIRNAQEEAFMAIGAVVACLEQDFQKYLDQFVPLLLQGLSCLEMKELCMICTGGVVDLCGGVGNMVQPYADKIMETMFTIIRDTSVHRDVKPVVISCFGDMAMAIGAGYQPYMQLTMMLLMQASQQTAPGDNEEMIAFINKLRCSVLEAYSGILIGLAEGDALSTFLPNLPNIGTFLNFLATDTTKDQVVLQKSVGLIGDIAHECGARAEIKQLLNQQFVFQLLQEAVTSQSTTMQEEARWAHGTVQKVIQAP